MLTYKRANELLRYDPETGKLYWRVSKSGGRANAEAGTIYHGKLNAYRRVGVDGLWQYAHRIVWLLHYGIWPENEIDHLNGNGLDNRIENLMDATRAGAHKSRRRSRYAPGCVNGVNGVFWHEPSGKWVAQIRVNGKLQHLGGFTDFIEADAARRNAVARRKAADESGYTERLLRQRT